MLYHLNLHFHLAYISYSHFLISNDAEFHLRFHLNLNCEFWETDASVSLIPGHIPDGHFPDGHFPNRHFPDQTHPQRTFPRKAFPRPDTFPTATSPTDIFAPKHPRRTPFQQIFTLQTFPRPDTSPMDSSPIRYIFAVPCSVVTYFQAVIFIYIVKLFIFID